MPQLFVTIMIMIYHHHYHYRCFLFFSLYILSSREYKVNRSHFVGATSAAAAVVVVVASECDRSRELVRPPLLIMKAIISIRFNSSFIKHTHTVTEAIIYLFFFFCFVKCPINSGTFWLKKVSKLEKNKATSWQVTDGRTDGQMLSKQCGPAIATQAYCWCLRLRLGFCLCLSSHKGRLNWFQLTLYQAHLSILIE